MLVPSEGSTKLWELEPLLPFSELCVPSRKYIALAVTSTQGLEWSKVGIWFWSQEEAVDALGKLRLSYENWWRLAQGLERTSGAKLEKAKDTFKVPDSYTINRLTKVWYVCIRTCSIFWGNFPEQSCLQYLKFKATNLCLPYMSQFLHVLPDDIQPSWKRTLLFTLWQLRLFPLMFQIVTLFPELYFEEDRIICFAVLFHWRCWSISTSEAHGHLSFPVSLWVNMYILTCILNILKKCSTSI